MVEQPYHDAEDVTVAKKYTDLADAITEHGRREAERMKERYDRDPAEYCHTEYRIDSWVNGPLVYVARYDKDGETQVPTLDNSLVTVVFDAGYIPWGFRLDQGDVFMWYLRPVEDVTERDIVQAVYAIHVEDGGYLREDKRQTLVTFEDEDAAEVMAEQMDGAEVRRILQ